MSVMTLTVHPARSRQEVADLINFLGESNAQLQRIEAETQERIEYAAAEARAVAEAQALPIRAAVAEAQAKVQAWFRVHPEAAASMPGAEAFVVDPMEAQQMAVVLSSARPLTQRQIMILELLKAGQVLRRVFRRRSYSLVWPEHPERIPRHSLPTNHVFDLQHRYLDAFDEATGGRLLGVSAFDARKIEFRLKPDVVLP